MVVVVVGEEAARVHAIIRRLVGVGGGRRREVDVGDAEAAGGVVAGEEAGSAPEPIACTEKQGSFVSSRLHRSGSIKKQRE